MQDSMKCVITSGSDSRFNDEIACRCTLAAISSRKKIAGISD
jgi:hypothetical protein